MKDKNNSWTASNQASGVDASCYTAWVYDFMLSRLNRNSYDAQGAFMDCIVEYPGKHNNASFQGNGLFIGDVAPDTYYSFAGNPDVVAHEWAHGITYSHANLLYRKESGALSEAFSNMMGAYFNYDWLGQHTDNCWLIGKNHWRNDPSKAVNNMKEPHLTGQPDTYLRDNLWQGLSNCIPNDTNDYCYVHTNCGVPNKMFYLLSNGGTFNGIAVQSIGIDNAFKILYYANTGLWDSLTTFCQAKSTSVTMARSLEITGNWAIQTGAAWNAVGVCPYVVGDANGNGECRGSDLTLITAYLKGTASIPPDCKCTSANHTAFWMSADYNGDCQILGADVSYGVRYFKGLGPAPIPCPEFPPSGN